MKEILVARLTVNVRQAIVSLLLTEGHLEDKIEMLIRHTHREKFDSFIESMRTLGLNYYNYRHYNPLDGRWVSRDPIEEDGGWNLYGMINNYMINIFDYLGQEDFEGHVDLGILTNLHKVTGTILIDCPPSLDNISVNFVEPTFKTEILKVGPTYKFIYIYEVELESIVTIGKGEKCGDCQTYNVALDVNMQVTYSEETYRKGRLVALKKGNKESKDGFSRNFPIKCCEDEMEDEV